MKLKKMKNDIAIFTPMANEEKGAKKFIIINGSN